MQSEAFDSPDTLRVFIDVVCVVNMCMCIYVCVHIVLRYVAWRGRGVAKGRLAE